MAKIVRAVVVCYNRLAGESPAVRSLSLQHVQVRVRDNSDDVLVAEANRVWCRERGVEYRGGDGNLGIVGAYLAEAQAALDAGEDNSWIVWFDDDSQPASDYAERVKEFIEGHAGVSVVLPTVVSTGQVVSPSRLTWSGRAVRLRPGESTGGVAQRVVVGLNSGMAVKVGVYRRCQYDRSLKVECVDFQFLLDCQALGMQVGICHNAVLGHSLSRLDMGSRERSIVRYRGAVVDYARFFRGNPIKLTRTLFPTAVRLGLRYRTVAFVSVFFRGAVSFSRERGEAV